MLITFIKAKSLIAAERIAIYDANPGCKPEDLQAVHAGLIECAFIPDPNIPPIFAMSPFSGVVGCGIHRIGDPGKIIAIVPPQLPFALDMTANAVSARALHGIDAIKQETERVCRLILQALNAS